MKKKQSMIKSMLFGIIAIGLLGQPAQLHAQPAQLQKSVSQSFNDFYRYFKERFPNVAATPSQVKAIWEVGVKRYRGEPISPELRQAALAGAKKLGISFAAILAIVATYLSYKKLYKPWRLKKLEEKGDLLQALRGDYYYYREHVMELIKAGADPNVQDFYGYTPLHLAAEKGRLHVVEALIKSGAVIDAQTQGTGHVTPLKLALINEKDEVAAALINAGATLPGLLLLLHSAAEEGHLHVVKALIKRGADVNMESLSVLNPGKTPLYLAAEKGHLHVVKALIEAGADVNVKSRNTSNPKTPLRLAAEGGHFRVAMELLIAGADPYTSDSLGAAPIDNPVIQRLVKNITFGRLIVMQQKEGAAGAEEATAAFKNLPDEDLEKISELVATPGMPVKKPFKP